MRKKHVGDVGEHWVLYRLVRHGYTAVLAPTNARSVDILASDEHGRPVSIQVKTKANAVGWRLTESAERVADDRLFYCLVDLGRSGDMEPPEVYVVPSAVVAKTVREGHARWLRGTKRSGEPRKDSAIRQIVLGLPMVWIGLDLAFVVLALVVVALTRGRLGYQHYRQEEGPDPATAPT